MESDICDVKHFHFDFMGTYDPLVWLCSLVRLELLHPSLHLMMWQVANKHMMWTRSTSDGNANCSHSFLRKRIPFSFFLSFSTALLVTIWISSWRTEDLHKVHNAMTHYCSIRSGIFLNEGNISCTGHSFSSQLQRWASAGLRPSIMSWPSARCPAGGPGARGEWLMSSQPPPPRTKGPWYPSSIIRPWRLQISIAARSFNYSRCWITLSPER